MGPSRPRALPSEADSGMPRVTLRSPSGEACVVFTHGAHVASWTDADGGENLFMSEAAVFKPPKALRGGVPVCWPQFGGVGDLQAHGFARNSEWTVKVQTDDQVVMTLKVCTAPRGGCAVARARAQTWPVRRWARSHHRQRRGRRCHPRAR